MTPHALLRLTERKLTKEMVAEAIEEPDRISKDLGGNDKYQRVITTSEGIIYALIVVVDESRRLIITVMEDDDYQ